MRLSNARTLLDNTFDRFWVRATSACVNPKRRPYPLQKDYVTLDQATSDLM
jgi:hypothetical protein